MAKPVSLRTHSWYSLLEGVDSPATCCDDQLRQFARWLKAVGAVVETDATGRPKCSMEISPLFGYDADSFAESWSTFTTGTVEHLVRVIERLHGRRLDPEKLEPATRAWLVDREPPPLVDYLDAAERLWAFGRRILTGWAPDDVLLTPTLTRLPAPVGGIQSEAGVTDDAGRFSALVRIWNVTGQPAISLPLAETADGVPVGVQLVAAHGRDDLLLSVAAQLEANAGWKPAGTPAASAYS